MKKDSFQKNFAFQIFYQFIIIVIPLIISPYLTRILGSTQLGIYTYNYTIAYYFVVVSMLGINKYGQRIISTAKDQYELRKNFWSLFTLHAIISLFCTIIYLCVIFLINDEIYIFLALGMFVISNLFDITWLFYGLENFKTVVIRNAIIKILECILIFTLVKCERDILVYTLIKSGCSLLSQVILIPYAIKNITPCKFSLSEMTTHLKPMIVFGIFVMASLLYTVFDKTLIGIFCSKEDVAFYEYANKIVELPKVFAMVIGTVFFPKACINASTQNSSEIRKKYFLICLHFTYFICIGAMFGLFVLSKDLSVLYYGTGFEKSGEIMQILIPIALLISFSNVIENIFLIPYKMDKKLAISILLGALINVILSSILIYYIGVIGAVLGTIVSEFIKVLLQLFFARKMIPFKLIITTITPYLISGILMFGLLIIINRYIELSIINFIIEVLIGLIVYILVIFIYLFVISKDKKTYREFISKKIRR